MKFRSMNSRRHCQLILGINYLMQLVNRRMSMELLLTMLSIYYIQYTYIIYIVYILYIIYMYIHMRANLSNATNMYRRMLNSTVSMRNTGIDTMPPTISRRMYSRQVCDTIWLKPLRRS